MIKRLLARAFWTVSPWTLRSEDAPSSPSVFVAAPHTSNWDFILMLAVAWQKDIDIFWVGKDALFKGIGGKIMRALGGVAVDRKNPQNVVSELVERMSAGHGAGLVITPDGTRGGHEYWKSGFYRIAQETGLPVTLAYVDRHTMTSGLGPTFTLTGDVSADMDRIREFFADKSGFYPHKRVEPRLRSELNPDTES